MYLNLNNVSAKASDALIKLDYSFVGTKDYMGLTYFWHSNFKHYLRDNSNYWLEIHTALLNAGLNVSGYSKIHCEVIGAILKTNIEFEMEVEKTLEKCLIDERCKDKCNSKYSHILKRELIDCGDCVAGIYYPQPYIKPCDFHIEKFTLKTAVQEIFICYKNPHDEDNEFKILHYSPWLPLPDYEETATSRTWDN